jgi:DNA-binding winged helix-turn-helix (wHTH) protein
MEGDVTHVACDVLSFGPFELRPRERLLIRGDQPVSVSGRGLDILIALATHPGEVLTKRDLMARHGLT